MTAFRLEFRSALRTPAEVVWAHASSMEGVNRELRPWVRMTVPSRARGRSLAEVETGREAFVSVLLMFGVVPFDVHHLTLAAVFELGFDEESWSWLQRRWRHERRVEPTPEGCVVTDRLTVAPRLLPGWAVRPVVRAIFASRHRSLRARFGASGG